VGCVWWYVHNVGIGNSELISHTGPFVGSAISAGMFGSLWLLRRELVNGRYRAWAYCAALLSTVAAMPVAFIWFRTPMHDFALRFYESHGRWGCTDDSLWIRDATVPWILFCPVIAGIVSHGCYRLFIWFRSRALPTPHFLKAETK
jgi:hypothetical protein